MNERILIVDDKPSILEILNDALETEGYEVAQARSGAESLGLLCPDAFDLVFCDVRMPDVDGLDVLKHIQEKAPKTLAVMITAYGSVENAIHCMKLGAYDYITKPFNIDEIKEIARRALAHRRLMAENEALRAEVEARYSFHNIIGKSKAMQQVFQVIQSVAPTDAAVLVSGETGTGKELIAKAIHYNSKRSSGFFQAINCAALTPSLLESELFGHEKGSFTGAYSSRKGLFEEASGGTLLLDEISEMDVNLQAKLLRALDEKMIRRVGGNNQIPIDIRLICSTNRNLEEFIERGLFRLDLYHRIKVVHIKLPPLRERREDLPLLVRRYLGKYAQRYDKPDMSIEPEAMEMLARAPWPGNVRELINVLEQAVVLSEDSKLTKNCFGDLFSSMPPLTFENAISEDLPTWKEGMARAGKALLLKALEETDGNRKEAAKRLAISERTLYYRLEEFGIGPEK